MIWKSLVFEKLGFPPLILLEHPWNICIYPKYILSNSSIHYLHPSKMFLPRQYSSIFVIPSYMKHNVDAKRWDMQKGNIIMVQSCRAILQMESLRIYNSFIDGVNWIFLSAVVEQYYVMWWIESFSLYYASLCILLFGKKKKERNCKKRVKLAFK